MRHSTVKLFRRCAMAAIVIAPPHSPPAAMRRELRLRFRFRRCRVSSRP